MMVSLGLKMIRKTILSKAKFDIKCVLTSYILPSPPPPNPLQTMTYIHFSKLEPIEAASSCFVPVLLVHGESDTFIGAHHAKEMYVPSPSSFIKLL